MYDGQEGRGSESGVSRRLSTPILRRLSPVQPRPSAPASLITPKPLKLTSVGRTDSDFGREIRCIIAGIGASPASSSSPQPGSIGSEVCSPPSRAHNPLPLNMEFIHDRNDDDVVGGAAFERSPLQQRRVRSSTAGERPSFV
eukprot:CAMPEP_0119121094 /NCGR_PEP_ID=MMETSP1310-20130426/1870_1 /TAXON_ID=464262 /ORGANISM="Genus nov. species nov., Strain RCC2339" /LENGTH=141 /DNA_ID=CAMNT_0007110633 /DNA_START=143 /DNA_END=568 /DNA_ORIENTATION=+